MKNNNIQIFNDESGSSILKTPMSEFSYNQFENNLKAKKKLGIQFEVVNDGKARSIKRKFIQGITGKQIIDELNEEKLKSLAKKLLFIHKHKGSMFGESLIHPKVKSLKEIISKRLLRISSYLSDEGLLNELSKQKIKDAGNMISVLPEIVPSLVHFDIHDENLIWDGAKIHIIDYENSRYYDHIWDLAITIVNMELDNEYSEYFLEHYFNRLPTECERHRIRLYLLLNELRSLPYEEI